MTCRRLLFTIGMDEVTGQADVVTFSPGVEHKTEFASISTSGSGRNPGYPDPGYLDRLAKQLKSLGVADESEVVEQQHALLEHHTDTDV